MNLILKGLLVDVFPPSKSSDMVVFLFQPAE